MLKNRIATMIVGATLAALPAMSQEIGRNEVSVQALGSFVKSTTSDGVRQSATDSGGVLANYRYFFAKNHGVEGTYGYSLNTQLYGSNAGLFGVKAHQHEVSGAYVYRLPLRGVTPFAEAGAAALVFDPKNLSGVSSQTRAAFLYGAGVDVKIASGLFLRAQYRGFLYNSPTFDLNATQGTDRTTHRAEPSVGFGYRF